MARFDIYVNPGEDFTPEPVEAVLPKPARASNVL